MALAGAGDGGARDDREPDLARPGEDDEGDRRVLDQEGAQLLADAREESERPGRESRLEEDLDQPQGDAGRLLGGLEEHAVAGH